MSADRSNEGAAPPVPVIRRLLWHERELFSAHLLQLSPEDRHMRFGGLVGDDFIRRYAQQLQWFRCRILGCFVAGELVGVAEFRLLDGGWPADAELAFSVASDYQGQGIGTELFRRMVIFARNRAVGRLFIVTLPSNRRMRHIAAKFGMELEPEESEVAGRLELRWPNALSLLDEALEEGRAWLLDGPWSVMPSAGS